MAPSRPLRRLAAASLVLTCAIVVQASVAHAAHPRAQSVRFSDVPAGY
jgi:hypothetical protein